MIMKKDCYFYEAGVILLGSFQLCPLLLLLGSTIISVLLGVCWVLVLAWFYTLGPDICDNRLHIF